MADGMFIRRFVSSLATSTGDSLFFSVGAGSDGEKLFFNLIVRQSIEKRPYPFGKFKSGLNFSRSAVSRALNAASTSCWER